tara:strand:- start:257 stop:1555 length:1299 start_codon:yes stop_codon:yes gene_type:complete
MSFVLNAVKSFTNYGIVLSGTTTDPALTKGFFLSSPNVSIIGNSCYIDYSNTSNISDLTYLNKLFFTAPIGTTYSISSGDYYDEFKNVRTDISGVFSKSSFTNNGKLLIGSIVSGLTYTSNYSYYDKSYFINPPQYTTGYTGAATLNFITNNITSNPAKSFINSGPIGSCFSQEEYVELSGTTLNAGKLKINSVIKLKDNKELLYVDNTLVSENLGATATSSTFYIRGNANPDILNKSRKLLGCYIIYDSNGNQTSCFENQNQLQGFLRSQATAVDYSAYWVPCLDCSRLTDNALNAASSDKTLFFDANVFFYITQQALATVNDALEVVLSYVYTLNSNAVSNSNLQATSAITFTIDNGFKIDLSHPSLKGFEVEAYLDSSYTVPMSQYIYKLGILGFDQASLIYQKTTSSSKLIYLQFTGPTVINVQITVI